MTEKGPTISHLGLVPIFMNIGAATITRTVTGPFQRKKGARTYRRDVLFSAMREILTGFDTDEGQYLSPPTDKVYKKVARSKKWKEHTIELDHGAKAHWLGHSNAKYAMIYCHGGGYIAPATPGHMKYQFALQKYLRKQGIDLSVFSLSYILAPKGVYPVQIKQALSALQYLIEKDGRDPSTILVAGDSAGGNLTSALLLHLGHPHPLVTPYTLSAPLKAAVLISPWISFETESPSFKKNAQSDYLTIPAVNRANAAFIGPGKQHDEYSEPIKAPVEWWKEVAKGVVSEFLVWGGGGEVLVDSIKAFGEKIIEGFAEVDSVVPPAEPIDESAKSGNPLRTANGNVDAASEANPAAVVESVGENTEGEGSVDLAKENTNPGQEAEGKIEGTATEPNSGNAETGNNANIASESAHTVPETNGKSKGSTSKKGKDRVKLIITPREAHEEMIIDYVLKIRGKGEGAKEIENWLTSTLKD